MSEYKVIVLGPTGVGKTALVEMYIRQVFSETSDPSFEDSYRKVFLAWIYHSKLNTGRIYQRRKVHS